MEIGQRLQLQMRQSPQQVLLSTLLQLPTLALEQRIKLELQDNPLLEEVLEEELDIEEQTDPELSLEQDENEKSEKEEEPEDTVKEEEKEEKEEIDWDLILDEEEYEFKIPVDKSAEIYERPEVSETTLAEHLLEQLNLLTDLTEQERVIGEYIIWNINEDGYFSCSLDEITLNLDVRLEEVEKILKLVQSFDPVGIGARELRECLLIQLEDRDGSDIAKNILLDYYEDFKNKRFEKIAKKMEISLDEIKISMEEIAKLNPKPGEGLISQSQNYVIPDVIVERVDDDFVVILNETNVPSLRINATYRKMLADRKKTTKEVKNYIRKRLESARWLISSIHQRRATIYRVMNEIIDSQKEFFDKGPGHIKPMILKNIADEVNMDISTISRVTNGKYVQTDHGVFELKYFFTEKMQTTDGKDISNREIKDKIRQIIDDEDPHKPLNDQTIVAILKNYNYSVARRTVAKYREQMKIPVARMRRKI